MKNSSSNPNVASSAASRLLLVQPARSLFHRLRNGKYSNTPRDHSGPRQRELHRPAQRKHSHNQSEPRQARRLRRHLRPPPKQRRQQKMRRQNARRSGVKHYDEQIINEVFA